MGGIRHRRPEPVFLDRSGRRRRLVGIAGAALGTLLAAAVVVLLAGFIGGAPVAVPGLPPVRHADQPRVATTSAHPDTLLTPEPVPVAGTTTRTPAPVATTAAARVHGQGQSQHPHPTKSR